MRRVVRPRRHTEWGSFSLDFEALPVGTCQSYTLFSAAQLIDFESPTIIRTYLKALTMIPNTAGAGNIHEQLAIGIGVQSEQAVAAGALPCPFTNASWGGWLLHWYSHLGREDVARSTYGGERELIDSRAMRKVQEGDAVFLSLETPSTNVSSVNVSFSGRMLFKE